MANFPKRNLEDNSTFVYDTLWLVTFKDGKQKLCDECTEVYNECQKRQEYKLRVIDPELSRYLSAVELDNVISITKFTNVRFTQPEFNTDIPNTIQVTFNIKGE